MGLSSQTTKTTSKEQATTTPNLAPYTQGPIENYYAGLSGLMDGDSSAFAPKTNPLLMKAAEGARNLGSDYSGAYGYINNAAQSAFGVPNAATTSVNGPAAPTAAQAKLPGAPSLTKVGNVSAPDLMKASVGDYGPVALASDSSGLADKNVATFGGASGLAGIQSYLDPQINDYVKAYNTNFDDMAGREQAAYALKGAKSQAFGGSRYGIGEAQLISDLTNKRALGEAGLRSDAWKTAADFSSRDADRANAAGIASMQAQNQRDETLASLARDFGIANAGALNDRQKSIFDARNELGMFNASEGNDLSSQIYDALIGNARQDAAAGNDLASLLFSQGAETNRFNTGQKNDLASQVYGERNTNARQDAAAANDMSQFNARLGLDRAGLQMDAGRALADIGSAEAGSRRADIGLQADLAAQLMDIQQRQDLAPYAKQQMLAELLTGSGLLGTITGQTINSTGSGTSKQSGGLMGSILSGAFGLGAAALGKK